MRRSLTTRRDAAGSARHVEIDDTEEAAPVFAPLVARVPDNAPQLLARLAEIEDAAERQFEDGDMTASEYREARASISEQRDEIKWRKREAELAENFVETAKTNDWNREVEYS